MSHWKVLAVGATGLLGAGIALLVMVTPSSAPVVSSSTSTPSKKTLPGSVAGTSTASGPGVPPGFSGTLQNSIDLSPDELAAIVKANELSRARDAETRYSLDPNFPRGEVER